MLSGFELYPRWVPLFQFFRQNSRISRIVQRPQRKQNDNGKEKNKKRNRFHKPSKTSERAAHFLADFSRHCTTDVVKLDCNGNAIVALTLSLPNVAKRKIQQKFQISFQNFEKQISCISTRRKVSFEWSHFKISSTDSKVRTTLQTLLFTRAVKGLIFMIVPSAARIVATSISSEIPRGSITQTAKQLGFLQSRKSLFAVPLLAGSAKPRFDRLKRELLQVYNIIVKCH